MNHSSTSSSISSSPYSYYFIFILIISFIPFFFFSFSSLPFAIRSLIPKAGILQSARLFTHPWDLAVRKCKHHRLDWGQFQKKSNNPNFASHKHHTPPLSVQSAYNRFLRQPSVHLWYEVICEFFFLNILLAFFIIPSIIRPVISTFPHPSIRPSVHSLWFGRVKELPVWKWRLNFHASLSIISSDDDGSRSFVTIRGKYFAPKGSTESTFQAHVAS